MSRMYSTKSIDELETIFAEFRQNEFQLNVLRAELSYRTSHRARALLKKVENLLGPLQTNSHLIKQPTREPKAIGTPADPTYEEFEQQFGLELIQTKNSLEQRRNAASEQLRVKQEAAWDVERRHRQMLERLKTHVFSVVPISDRSDEEPVTVFDKGKQLERVHLIQAMYRSFPDLPLLQRLETEKSQADKALKSSQIEFDEVNEKFDKLLKYFEGKEQAVVMEAENQIVKQMAVKMTANIDNVALLRLAQSTGLADPIGLIARARMYATNVLSKKGRSD